MTLVVSLRVSADEPPHAQAERRGWCLDDSMEVSVHEAVRMDPPLRALRRARKTGDQRESIVVVRDDAPAAIASGYDMLKRSCNVDAWLARHRTRVANRPREYQMAVTASSWRPTSTLRAGVRLKPDPSTQWSALTREKRPA